MVATAMPQHAAEEERAHRRVETVPDAAVATCSSVLLLDDPDARVELREVLETQPDLRVVAEVGSAHQALARSVRERPDVVVAGLELADGSGIDACRRIRSADPSIAVLVVTPTEDQHAAVAAAAAGAAGFVCSEPRSHELVHRIRRAAQGEQLPPPRPHQPGRPATLGKHPGHLRV